MSAVVSEMLIRIAADTAQLRSQMQQAEQTVGGSLNGIKNIASQARNALIGFFAIDKAMDLAGAFIKTADAMALTSARLKLVTTSESEFLAVQKDVYRISQQNSIGLEEMSQLYAKLHEPVKRLGGTTAETTKITESFALALRVGGANTQEAASATLQFAQAMASGKLSGDEFRSIAEASPRFMKALADGMGVPIEKLKEMGSESKLTADVVGNALMKSLAQLKQEAQGIPDTVGGAFQRLKNDVAVFAVELNGASNATGSLAEVIGGLADWVKQITAVFKAWSDATKGTTDQVDIAGIAIKVLGTIFETLIVVGAELAFMVRAIGKSFVDVATLAKAFADGGLEGLSDAYKKVTAENKASLEAHNKFTAGVVGATSRVLQQRDALKNHSLSAGENANEIARLTGRHGQAETATLRSTIATKEQTDAAKKAAETEIKRAAEVKKLMDSIEDQTAALIVNENATESLTKSEQFALKVMQDLQHGRIKLTDAEKVALTASLELLIQTEKRIKADKDLAETKRKVAEHSAKLTEAEWKEVEALREGNVKLMEQNEVLRLGEDAVRAREVAVMRSTASDLEFKAANEGGNAALEEQARLLRQRADLVEDNAGLQAAKAVKDEWAETAKNIETSLTDALMRGFESGKGFFENLREVAVNMFKTLVLRPIIQPIAQGMAGTVLSAMGMNASASTGGGAGGSLSLSNLVSGGMNFLNGSMITDMATSGISNLGAGIGGDFGANLMMNSGTYGAYLGMAGNAFAGYGLGKMANGAISGGYQISSGMSTMQDIGSAVAGALAGPLGGLIAGAVSGLVNRAFGRKLTDQGIEGNFSGGNFAGQSYQFFKGGWFRSDKTKYGDLDSEMGEALSAGSQAIYQQVKAYAEALKLPAGELANVSSYMKISLSDDAEKNKQAIADAMTAYGDVLVSSFSALLVPFQREGEKLIETLQRLSILQQFSDSINQLGGIFSTIAGSSIEAREALIGMAGGIDALMGKAATFIQEYYSQDEKAGMLARDVANALQSVGIDTTNLATREDFRALVESRDVETDAGRQQLVALLNLAPQFAGLADYIKENDTTLAELVESAPQVAVLQNILDPAMATADATLQMASSLDQSNATLTAINGNLEGIAASSAAAAAAAAAAASAAEAAATAAQSLVYDGSAPQYAYNIGGL